MTDVERIVHKAPESCDLRHLERGAAAIDENFNVVDSTRGEYLAVPKGCKRDYHRWCATVLCGKGFEGGDCDHLADIACLVRFLDE